jgi:hypothetical protein
MDSVPLTRARRVVLATGVPLVLAAICVCTATLVHAAARTMLNLRQVSYSVRLSVPVTGPAIHVTSDLGNMTVRAGSGRDIAVRGVLAGSVQRPQFSHRATRAGLALDSRCRVPVGNCSASYDITIPARPTVSLGSSFGNLGAAGLTGTVTLADGSGNIDGARLAGHIRMGDSFGTITASNLSGSTSLNNSSGDIDATAVTGNTQIQDSFGNIHATHLSGRINLNNNSGDIDATAVTGNTQIQDSFGNVVVTGIAAADVHAVNQSGDITIIFSTVPRLVTVTDSFGNVLLELPAGDTRYRVSAHDQFGSEHIGVPQAASAANVITASNNSGNLTIINRPGAPYAPSAPAAAG